MREYLFTCDHCGDWDKNATGDMPDGYGLITVNIDPITSCLACDKCQAVYESLVSAHKDEWRVKMAGWLRVEQES